MTEALGTVANGWLTAADYAARMTPQATRTFGTISYYPVCCTHGYAMRLETAAVCFQEER
jgi:hypothetical protein